MPVCTTVEACGLRSAVLICLALTQLCSSFGHIFRDVWSGPGTVLASTIFPVSCFSVGVPEELRRPSFACASALLVLAAQSCLVERLKCHDLYNRRSLPCSVVALSCIA